MFVGYGICGVCLGVRVVLMCVWCVLECFWVDLWDDCDCVWNCWGLCSWGDCVIVYEMWLFGCSFESGDFCGLFGVFVCGFLFVVV